MVAVGSGKQTGEGFGSGTGKDALVLKKRNCEQSHKYWMQSINGEGCQKLEW